MTTILVLIAALTFAFSFGNIWALGLRLGVQPWLAPLIGPAVDLSVVGLLVGIRYCTLNGVSPTRLRPARALLVFSGLTTLALNVAEPVMAGEYGRALFDSVGPLLLIGWSEVGPSLIREIHTISNHPSAGGSPSRLMPASAHSSRSSVRRSRPGERAEDAAADDELLEKARQADLTHRAAHGRPISADTLRRELSISSAKARAIAVRLRTQHSEQP
ncbi:DUF2637 domain-containing protein [Planomonospora alba]|uniref:DUF2637 domain-containing protein n=1 Tax=Planomonospora alba TaxID=161354 RepID=UPI0031ED5737